MHTAAAEAVGKFGNPALLRDFQAKWESRCLTFPLCVFSTAFRARHFFTIARYTTGQACPDNLASKDGSQMVVVDAAALSLSPLVVALAKPGSLYC